MVFRHRFVVDGTGDARLMVGKIQENINRRDSRRYFSSDDIL